MRSKIALGLCISTIALALSACGGTDMTSDDEVIGSASEAVQSPDGPFSSNAALSSYWAAQPGGVAFQIYSNGHLVYYRGGFGPPWSKQYFNCANGSGINALCIHTDDGYDTIQTAINTLFGGWTVYVDNALYVSGKSSIAYLKKCTGDASPFGYGPDHYYIVTGEGGSVFSPLPPFRSSCYP